MNKSQKKQLEILEEVDRICNKNNIQYFLDGGTLLGAVRHKGFIPWDDDIDIGMPRKEYEKFKEVIKTELSDKFFFQDLESDPNIGFIFGKIRINNTKYVEEMAENVKIHQGIYIDIFPFDEYKSNSSFIFKKVVFYRMLLLIKSKYTIKTDTIIKKIELIILKILTCFISKKRIINKIKKNIELNVGSKKYVVNYSTPYFNKYLIEKKYFDDIIDVDFEGKKFKTIKHYDEYLSFLYGDYMQLPPIEKRVTHGIIEIDYGE